MTLILSASEIREINLDLTVPNFNGCHMIGKSAEAEASAGVTEQLAHFGKGSVIFQWDSLS